MIQTPPWTAGSWLTDPRRSPLSLYSSIVDARESLTSFFIRALVWWREPGRGLRNPYMTVYRCKRSTNGTYPTVFRRITWLRITIANDLSNMSFRTVNDVFMQKCTASIYDDDKQPFSCAPRWSYFIVNDTEEYNRNTEPCNTECYGKIRSRRPY